MPQATHEHHFIFALLENMTPTAMPDYYRSLWICQCGAMREQYHADDGIKLEEKI